MRGFLFPVLLAALWTGAAQGQPNTPWPRMVIVGASVSRGFTASEPFGGTKSKEYALDRYLSAAVLAPHDPPKNLANALFFVMPDDMGHEQIRQAMTNQPTLVIGIDFLFWFSYGRGQTDRDRQTHFEKGLKLLEALDCPLIVGDIPDASAAVNRMLSPDEIPSREVRESANHRLKDWAAQHKQVTVVPLAEFMRAVASNQSWTGHDFTLARGATRSLLQDDRLHPNQRGCAVLALSIFDAFLAGRSGLEAAQVRWDPDEVLRQAGHF
jgi:hypothetical protein